MNVFLDSSSSSPLPNAQQWRTYLRGVALELELMRADNRHQASEASAACVSRSTRRGSKLKDAAKEIFYQALPKKEDVKILVWNDRVVWRRTVGPSFRDIDCQRLVWDTEEHSFRAELTTLDHLIMSMMWDTDAGGNFRSQKLSAMWPDGGHAMMSLPSESSGVAAEDWVKRGPYIEAFRQILMGWPGEVPCLLVHLSFLSVVDGQDHWNKPLMEQVERLAARHYCQAFFDHFARAPCVPRIFPIS